MPTLCDAGPLVAIINPADPSHGVCDALLSALAVPLVTTWPAFTEAIYLLYRIGGWRYQDELWNYIEDGTLVIRQSSGQEQLRARRLMEQYRDTPMDLADATLVTAAEVLRVHRIFTLDSDFKVYRTRDGRAFEIVP